MQVRKKNTSSDKHIWENKKERKLKFSYASREVRGIGFSFFLSFIFCSVLVLLLFLWGARAGHVMPEEEVVDLKFRLYDGSDIGPFRYSPASTVAMLKDRIFADWPKDKKIIPKAANDIKLISAGKILENNKTVGQCRVPFGELPKGVITMHVVVQPSLLKAKTEKKVDEMPRKHICACSIL